MTKRIVSVFLAAVMLAALAAGASFTARGEESVRRLVGKVVYADVNGDGAVNSRDVVMIMKAVVGEFSAKYVEKAADCNFDGKINSRDVVLVMKTAITGEPIAAPAAQEIVCTTRDAFVLFDDDGFGDAEDGIADGWRLDERGGALRHAASGEYGVLADVSTDAGVALIREFNKIAVGRLDLETSVSVRGDGFSIEYRNDEGEAVYRLYTDGAWRVETPDGSVALTQSVDPDSFSDVSVSVDLDAGIALTSVDGGEYVESDLIVSGEAANIVDFRFATDAAHTPTVIPGAIRVTANYAANDDFTNMRGSRFSRVWTGSAALKGGALALGRGAASRTFGAVGDKVIAETQFILPRGENFSFALAQGETAALTCSVSGGALYANGGQMYAGFASNVRYRLRVEADVNAGSVVIKLNGRTLGETALAAPVASIDRVFIENASDSEIRVDSVAVYEKLAHDDYVPEPQLPAGGEDSLVGVFSDDMTLGDLKNASAQPELEPLLGFYDASSPEAADWEIKYLVEHGVDFEAFRFVPRRVNSTLKADMSDRLFGAYMNAEYSGMLKYCVLWDVLAGDSLESEQTFLDVYLPFFVENFFKDERYLTIENMPVVMISSAEFLAVRAGGNTAAANIICDLEDAALDLGFDGVLVISTEAIKSEHEGLGAAGFAPYTWGESGASAESAKAQITKSASAKTYAVPTVGVGQNGAALGGARSELIPTSEYKALNEWVKEEYLPKYAVEDWQKGLVMLSNLNDFGAGAHIMPCRDEIGFGYLDALRETYTAERAKSSLNVSPTPAQKARICRSFPQDRTALAKQGYVGASSASVYVNGARSEMNLPYETSPTGDLLIAFDPSISLDHMLRAFYAWDAQNAALTLEFADHTAVFEIGSDRYTLDGVEKELGYKLYDNDGLPLLPIERLCADVGYTCAVVAGEAHITSPNAAYYAAFTSVPAVFAVGEDYQIMFYQPYEAYSWIEIDGVEYNDAVCGNMRSAPGIRRVTVPQSALDEAKGYTVCTQKLIGGRQPYYTKTAAVTRLGYSFAPVPTDREFRAFMIGDSHNDIVEPLKAAKTFGAFDFLVLNGDISDDCSGLDMFAKVYELAADLTGGEKPVVYARGNHENRGAAAELLPDYLPTRNGMTYYTFRLGPIWGVVLDVGEDKDDTNGEFGGSARHAEFRRRETEYVRSIVANAENEYAAEGVEYRVAIVHVPFMYNLGEGYNVDTPLLTEWRDMLAAAGSEVVLSCHMHYFRFTRPGNSDFIIDPPCPVVVGSSRSDVYLGGAGLIFGGDRIDVKYVTSEGSVVREETIVR